MIAFYNWLICKLSKRCEIHLSSSEKVKQHGKETPWASECKLYDI